MDSHITVFGYGEAEQTIQKSRFIAYVSPASSREEADAFVEKIRKKHRDARHNVPAMIIGDKLQFQWGSDDGEPQGTAGSPIVQMLAKEGITDIVMVITRYFGGIKLGPGGLVRAYTGTAKLGLEAAGLCRVEPRSVLRCSLSYPEFNRFSHSELGEDTEIRDVEYGGEVAFDLVTTEERREGVIKLLESVTGGKGCVMSERTEKCKIRL